MPLNLDRVFIAAALKALKNVNLDQEKEKRLCEKLIELCNEFVPGTFKNTV